MSNFKVNYCWCDIDNFGDELNVELMHVLCNWELNHTPLGNGFGHRDRFNSRQSSRH